MYHRKFIYWHIWYYRPLGYLGQEFYTRTRPDAKGVHEFYDPRLKVEHCRYADWCGGFHISPERVASLIQPLLRTV